jgi:glycosyltransferase involved in cell wall biosynthesis
MADRTVTTLHGRLDLPDLPPLYRAFPEMPLVSISNAQRRPLPPVNWVATVYHGLPCNLLSVDPARKRDYLAFLGRISPEKRPDRAIETARRAGLPLKIAAKVDAVDEAYFEHTIKPLLDDSLVEFVGEIGETEKAAFLGGAVALLFTVDWPEPFGLVMIEAMACGTPVIAWRCGSVPEVIEDGVSGFIVDSIDAAVAAVPLAMELDPAAVRRRFEARFTVERMADDYVEVYRRLIGVPTEPEAEPLDLPVSEPELLNPPQPVEAPAAVA